MLGIRRIKKEMSGQTIPLIPIDPKAVARAECLLVNGFGIRWQNEPG
jgi:hypothetical protein